MLHDFLTQERSVILDRAKEVAFTTGGSRSTSEVVEKERGIFYDELIGLMELDLPFTPLAEKSAHSRQAEKHGQEYLRLGYTVSEVIQSYGIICQTITEFATERDFQISSREFQQLNLSLDTAVAEAVSEFERDRRKSVNKEEVQRLGYLAHELRNCIQSASIGLELIESGAVGIHSSTGGMLRHNLKKMTDIIDTTLIEVRLRSETKATFARVCVIDIISQVEQTARFLAHTKKQKLFIQGSSDYEVEVDEQLVVSALANLVQNAIKFTHEGGMVQVTSQKQGDRILIEVQDECGGLPDGKTEELFSDGVQRSTDRSGLGLGLAISRQAIERNHGILTARNLPGKGCVFTINLPKPKPKKDTAA